MFPIVQTPETTKRFGAVRWGTFYASRESDALFKTVRSRCVTARQAGGHENGHLPLSVCAGVFRLLQKEMTGMTGMTV